MTGIKVGYARCSTAAQDVEVQEDALVALGVSPQRIYVDHGRAGANKDRPGLNKALAAVREGDTLVVTTLDRLARSVRDASDLVDVLATKGVSIQIGTSRHDPDDPVSRLIQSVLAMVAEFERDLIRARTREGMAIARANGRLKGRKPVLSAEQAALLCELHRVGAHTPSELASRFGVSRATVYRTVARRQEQ